MQAPAVSTGQGTKGSLRHIQNITEIKPADIITWVSTGKQKKKSTGINQQLHEEVVSCNDLYTVKVSPVLATATPLNHWFLCSIAKVWFGPIFHPGTRLGGFALMVLTRSETCEVLIKEKLPDTTTTHLSLPLRETQSKVRWREEGSDWENHQVETRRYVQLRREHIIKALEWAFIYLPQLLTDNSWLRKRWLLDKRACLGQLWQNCL